MKKDKWYNEEKAVKIEWMFGEWGIIYVELSKAKNYPRERKS